MIPAAPSERGRPARSGAKLDGRHGFSCVSGRLRPLRPGGLCFVAVQSHPSLIGGSRRFLSALVLGTTTLQYLRMPRGFCRCAGGNLTTRELSDHQRIHADAWLLVPEGRRRKLAGGKPAPAGAAPGCHAERAMPQRGIGESFGVGRPAANPSPLDAPCRSGSQRRIKAARTSSQPPAHFYDAPLGHRAIRDGFQGRRPLLRTCPRLISSGIPPGRLMCDPATKLETSGARRAFQARSVAASPLCIHRVSVVHLPSPKPVAWPRPAPAPRA